MSHINAVNMETDNDSKRKRQELSSISDLDTSTDKVEQSRKDKKKKSKKAKQMGEIEEDNTLKTEEKDESTMSLKTQLQQINDKMSNMLTKNDSSLEEMIKRTFMQMKTELLKSVFHRIELLEGKLFGKESENDKLKENIEKLEKNLKVQSEENETRINELKKETEKTHGHINDLEQYGRRNNVRISGVNEMTNEHAEDTAQVVLKTLNAKMEGLKIKEADIDITHRVGNLKSGKRQIIVRFTSRTTRDYVMREKKAFKGTGIYVNEDLTYINQLVLSSLRKKLPDEIESAWSYNGRIFYKNTMGNKHQLLYEEFQHWIDLPWP